jgi:hypothetical protein
MRAFSGALSRRPQDGGMAGAALSKPLQPAQKGAQALLLHCSSGAVKFVCAHARTLIKRLHGSGERQGSALAGSQSAAQLAAAVAGSKASQQVCAEDASQLADLQAQETCWLGVDVRKWLNVTHANTLAIPVKIGCAKRRHLTLHGRQQLLQCSNYQTRR